jgi:FG-GAP-like repeat
MRRWGVLLAATWAAAALGLPAANGAGGFAGAVVVPTHTISPEVVVGDFNGDGKLDVARDGDDGQDATVVVDYGNGDGTFTGTTTLSVSGTPSASVIGAFDLNGDGIDDLVVGVFDGPIAIFLGTRDDTFSAPSRPAGSLNVARHAVSADFNHDGRPDLAVTDDGYSNCDLYYGNGDGTFSAAVTTACGGDGIALGDVNGDGFPDLVTTTDGGGPGELLEGNANGTFSRPVTLSGVPSGNSVAVADFDGDGHLDVAVVGNSGLTVSYGTGTGSFIQAASIASLNPSLTQLAVGEMNGDGLPDLIASGADGTSVFLSTGSRSFDELGPFYTGDNPVGFALGDFDGDGNLDLAALNFDPNFGSRNALTVALGRGDGTLETAPVYPSSGTLGAVSAGDLNGDGFPDLAFVDTASGKVQIDTNNGNGTFSPGAALAVGATASALVVADLDGDGLDDIVCADGSDVIVVHNLGGLAFREQTYATADGTPNNLVVGDFNHDGRKDILAGTGGLQSGYLPSVLLLGEANGSYAQATPVDVPSEQFHQMVVADFNKDGSDDVLTAADDTPQVSLSLGNGSFSAPTALDADDTSDVTAGDFNEDGDLDAVAADSRSNTIRVFLGNGNGAFGQEIDTTVPDISLGADALATGDFNGDGHLDLAIVGVDDRVQIMYGDGKGSFSAGPAYPTGDDTWDIASDDLNGDSIPDLILAERHFNDVEVLSPAPHVVVAGTRSFPTLAVGDASSPQTLTLQNEGNAPARFRAAGFKGPAAVAFTIVTDTCSDRTLAVGSSCAVSVRFTPDVAGVRNAVLELPANDAAGGIALALSGDGIGQPQGGTTGSGGGGGGDGGGGGGTAGPPPSLRITVGGPATAAVGGNVPLSLYVSNSGGAAYDTTVTIATSGLSNLSQASFAYGYGQGCTASAAGFTCEFVNIPAGSSMVLISVLDATVTGLPAFATPAVTASAQNPAAGSPTFTGWSVTATQLPTTTTAEPTSILRPTTSDVKRVAKTMDLVVRANPAGAILRTPGGRSTTRAATRTKAAATTAVYRMGARVKLIIHLKKGYVFVHWDGTACSGLKPTCAVVMNKARWTGFVAKKPSRR